MDVNEYRRQWQDHTAEELVSYEGQYVAWSEDRRHILAHAATLDLLIEEIERAGLRDYIIDSVLPPEEVFLGGADL